MQWLHAAEPIEAAIRLSLCGKSSHSRRFTIGVGAGAGNHATKTRSSGNHASKTRSSATNRRDQGVIPIIIHFAAAATG